MRNVHISMSIRNFRSAYDHRQGQSSDSEIVMFRDGSWIGSPNRDELFPFSKGRPKRKGFGEINQTSKAKVTIRFR
ncbi:unnamed protein product [Arabis nemorensis]|uniref:Uncharacterized protein n=1 Tax=Arabis nemorensis TaxID=586526 RepID=A0A565ALT4_9BRAS|nr:unnamed protein product [Arabis nemorensis]